MLDLLRPLAVFTTVAETGSFSAAANRLKLSPSVVSHHVSKLEERFGVALLYRSTRQLSLTAAGKDVLEQGRKVLEAGASAQDLLQADQKEPQGLLRITAPATLEHGRFMDDVAAFLELYPKIELLLDFKDERVDIIRNSYDLAIRAGALQDSELIAQRLVDVEDVLCASPAFLKEFGIPATPQELTKYTTIGVLDMTNVLVLSHRQNPKKMAKVDLRHKVSVNSGDAALSLALRGVGIARLPRLLIETRPDGELIDLLTEWQLPKVSLQAVWPKNTGRNSLSRLFVAHIVSILRSSAT